MRMRAFCVFVSLRRSWGQGLPDYIIGSKLYVYEPVQKPKKVIFNDEVWGMEEINVKCVNLRYLKREATSFQVWLFLLAYNCIVIPLKVAENEI